MLFTERLYNENKDHHRILDTHPFTKLIKKNRDAGNVYINFNKICIHVIQKRLDELIEFDEDHPFKYLYIKLFRPDLDKLDIFISSNLSILLERCEEFPLEHCYLFFLGLLMGGNILQKYLPQHSSFLDFGSILQSKSLVEEFKQHLNNTIKTPAYQECFINRVISSYKIIKIIFDDYYKKISEFEETTSSQ